MMGRRHIKKLKKLKQLLPVLIFILAFTFMTQEHLFSYIIEYIAQHVGSSRASNPVYVLIKSKLNERLNLNKTDWKTSKITTTTYTTTTTITTEAAKPYTKNKVRGERNAARTIEVCQKLKSMPVSELTLTVRFNRNNTLLFCPIYKVGTTFWRRVFMIESEKKYSNLVNPFEIPFDREYPSSKWIWKENTSNKFYKVMFTRDPYNRLFSFFVDKILAPNPYFWKNVGVKVAVLTRGIRMENLKSVCGHDISFSEFIKYVIYTLQTRRNVDPHWVEMYKNCHPCEIMYDFVGKMEDFQKDSSQILTKLGLTKMASFLDINGYDAATADAIKDTLHQPFSFRTKYKRCISFQEALLRAWKKLQIRGLIGNDTLDVRILNDKTTSLSDMVKRANISRHLSTSFMRKQIKEEAYQKFWSTVPIDDILKLQRLYSLDFELFDYEKGPDILFYSKSNEG